MELLIGMVLVTAGALPFIALILAGVAWSRVGQLRTSLSLVSLTVERWQATAEALERRVQALERAGARDTPPSPPLPSLPPRAAPAPAPPPPDAAVEVAPRRERLEALQAAQSPAPPPAPASASEPPATERPRPRIHWEQWLGVRGAAALGASVLVLAGIYFFQFSVEHGLLTPAMRVILGTLAGVGCLVAAETVLRKRHELLANCMAGAGIALLYLCFWAATALFQLIGTTTAGALMVGVTLCCGVLSVQRASRAIATLGLLGGFATPLMLSTGSDRPVALFAYLLILDAAILVVAHKQRWPLLALASLLGTAGYQGLWIVGRMGPERAGWGMLLCLLFAGLYALRRAPAPAEDAPGQRWRLTRAAAVVLPFCFALYFGLHADLEVSFWRLGGYLALLVTGAHWMAARDRMPWLGLAAACGATGVLAAWLGAHDAGVSSGQVAGFVALIAVIQQGFVERAARRGDVPADAILAAALWAVAGIGLTGWAAATTAAPSLWPWLAGWLVVAAIGLRLGAVVKQRAIWLASAIASGLALCALGAGQLGRAGFADAAVTIASFIGFAIAFQLGAFAAAKMAGDDDHARTSSGHAAAALPALLLLGVNAAALPIAQLIGATLLLLCLLSFAVVRSRAAEWLVAGAVAVTIAQVWAGHPASVTDLSDAARHALAVSYLGHALAAVLLVAFPLLLDAPARARRWTWRAPALSAVVLFVPMLDAHRRLFGDRVIALMPLGLATLTLGVMILARRRIDDAGVHKSALAWLGGATLAFVAVAIPLQLDNEWITIGWSLLALALIGLWRRVDHAGLKYVALALFGCVAVRLLFNVEVLGYHERGAWRVLNWLLYTYLVPAAAMVASIGLLARHERAQLRAWEPRLASGDPLTPSALGAAAVAVVFVWINLTIVDGFSAERLLTLSFERLPARDLTLSMAWALYGIGLLLLGMWRNAAGPRRAGLGLVLITCCKVFLYDLAHLSDLYRVVSLVGLALSLILVSLLYKRVVAAQEAP